MSILPAYYSMIASYAATLLVLLLSTFANAPDRQNNGAMWLAAGLILWLFKISPLLLFIPGLVKRSHKAAAWLSYVSMLYFIFAILLVFTSGAASWGWLMTLSTLILFISSMLFTRWQKALSSRH